MNIEDIKKEYEPIDGKWYIVKELGSGAFGTVLEVERNDFGNMKSAMKIISIPSSQSEVSSFRSENFDMDENSVTSYFYGFVEEFVKEFQLMAQLRGHSNIVSYEDHDIIKHKSGIGWDIFIRMELLTPVNDFFAQNPPTRKDVVKLGIDVCKALEVCQQYQIIHRDIKPSNIFISGTGEYKLGDFGVARTLEKTSSGLSKKGTYTYMAPEVFKGESYGSNVDIYSLGIVMYRLLNNNMEPFRTERTYTDSEQALAKRMRGEQITDIPGIDKNLSDIIVKACSYAPQERWQSPGEMRKALESLTDFDTVETLESSQEKAFDLQDDPGSDKTVGLFSQSRTGVEEGTDNMLSQPPEAETAEKIVEMFPQASETESEKGTTGVFSQTPKVESEAVTTGTLSQSPKGEPRERTTGIFSKPSKNEAGESTLGIFSQPPKADTEESTTGFFPQSNVKTEEQTSGILSQNHIETEDKTLGKFTEKADKRQKKDLNAARKADGQAHKHQTSSDTPNNSIKKILLFKGEIGKKEKFLSCIFWLSLLQMIAYVLPYYRDPWSGFSPSMIGSILPVVRSGFIYSGLIFATTIILLPFILMVIVFFTLRKMKKRNIICSYILNLIFTICSSTLPILFIGAILESHYPFIKCVRPGVVVDTVAILSKIVLSIVFFKSIFKPEQE